jgi:hypothetical protein
MYYVYMCTCVRTHRQDNISRARASCPGSEALFASDSRLAEATVASSAAAGQPERDAVGELAAVADVDDVAVGAAAAALLILAPCAGLK